MCRPSILNSALLGGQRIGGAPAQSAIASTFAHSCAGQETPEKVGSLSGISALGATGPCWPEADVHGRNATFAIAFTTLQSSRLNARKN